MGMKVAKFGGSSLADAAQFKKVREILFSDADRRIVVPSAPGKRGATDIKVTDLFYQCNRLAASGSDFAEAFDTIRARYREIAIKQLYDSSAAFQRLKPVYDGLQKIKFEKPSEKDGARIKPF